MKNKYTIKSFANEVCNLTMVDYAKDDEELANFFKIIQKTTIMLTGLNVPWSKLDVTDNVQVWTMPIGQGRMHIFYVIKENLDEKL